jgi:hypothetical protein
MSSTLLASMCEPFQNPYLDASFNVFLSLIVALGCGALGFTLVLLFELLNSYIYGDPLKPKPYQDNRTVIPVEVLYNEDDEVEEDEDDADIEDEDDDDIEDVWDDNEDDDDEDDVWDDEEDDTDDEDDDEEDDEDENDDEDDDNDDDDNEKEDPKKDPTEDIYNAKKLEYQSLPEYKDGLVFKEIVDMLFLISCNATLKQIVDLGMIYDYADDKLKINNYISIYMSRFSHSNNNCNRGRVYINGRSPLYDGSLSLYEQENIVRLAEYLTRCFMNQRVNSYGEQITAPSCLNDLRRIKAELEAKKESNACSVPSSL